MAVQKIQENEKQADGSYLIRHRETSADIVKFDNGDEPETDVQEEIEKLKNTKYIFFGAYGNFERPGKTDTLYIDTSSRPFLIYAWDTAISDFTLTGGSGTGGGGDSGQSRR